MLRCNFSNYQSIVLTFNGGTRDVVLRCGAWRVPGGTAWSRRHPRSQTIEIETCLDLELLSLWLLSTLQIHLVIITFFQILKWWRWVWHFYYCWNSEWARLWDWVWALRLALILMMALMGLCCSLLFVYLLRASHQYLRICRYLLWHYLCVYCCKFPSKGWQFSEFTQLMHIFFPYSLLGKIKYFVYFLCYCMSYLSYL